MNWAGAKYPEPLTTTHYVCVIVKGGRGVSPGNCDELTVEPASRAVEVPSNRNSTTIETDPGPLDPPIVAFCYAEPADPLHTAAEILSVSHSDLQCRYRPPGELAMRHSEIRM